MLTVTDKAVDALADTLDAQQVPDGQGLRLVHSGPGQLGLSIDQERDGDQVVAKDERPVLFVDPSVSEVLTGAVLDVVESPDGAKLALRLPGDK